MSFVKHSVLQLLKQNLRLIFFAPICAEVQVVVSVCITQEVFLCVCVCVCVCLSVIISLCSWVIFVYIDAVYWFYGCSFLCLIGCFSMIVWTPTGTVFECLICMRFLFLYLQLFSAIEHDGKAL